MDKSVLPGIKENIVSDFYLTPDYFEKELNTLHGSRFSIQPKFTQSAYFRFHNKSEVYKKLIFCWGGHTLGPEYLEYYPQQKLLMSYLNENRLTKTTCQVILLGKLFLRN